VFAGKVLFAVKKRGKKSLQFGFVGGQKRERAILHRRETFSRGEGGEKVVTHSHHQRRRDRRGLVYYRERGEKEDANQNDIPWTGKE